MTTERKDTIKGRRVAVLVADGVDADALYAVRKILEDGGAEIEIVASSMQDVKSTGNRMIKVHHRLHVLSPEPYDAVFIPGGRSIELLCEDNHALMFIADAHRRSKVIATSGEAARVVYQATHTDPVPPAVSLSSGLSARDGRMIHYIEGDGRQFFRRLVEAIAG